MKDKVVITAAITGAVHIPSMSPYLPVTPDQIIDQAVEASEAGAGVVHIHARKPENGEPTNDPKLVKYITDGIQARTDVILSVTTGGAIGMAVDERLQAIPVVKPELGSCNAGSVNFCFSQIADKIKTPMYDWEIPFVKNTYTVPFANTFESIERYIDVMQENGTKPEFEIYDVGMINNIRYFIQKGKLKTPVYLQFVMGIFGGIPATQKNLLMLLETANETLGKENFVWSCAAAGRDQFALTTVALTLGGNVRVGLEDNLYIKRGQLAVSNAEEVRKMAAIIELLDKSVATTAEARELLHLG